MNKDESITIEFGLKERALQYYFLNRGKVHAFTGAFIILSALFIVYFTSSPSMNQVAQAKELYSKWEQTPTDPDLYNKMRLSIKKIPGLERALEAQITQVLLSNGQTEAAVAAAIPCLERLRKQSPTHAAFAATSLLIEKQQYQKALEASVALKEELERNSAGQSNLYASNLMRIVFLQKQVSNAPGELCAWEDIKSLLEKEETTEAAKFLRDQFGDKAFTLSDFISQRERLILR